MIAKIKKLYYELLRLAKSNNKLIDLTHNHSNELLWADIFHDTIRGRSWLENLSISPGRMACNYSFLFLLSKILITCKPKRIIEFGLGESSKLISSFVLNELTDTQHHIIEHDPEWISFFSENFTLSKNSKIIQRDLVIKNGNELPHYSYDNLLEKIVIDYDLYIIDGPFGSKENSRNDIIKIAEQFKKESQFIVVFDDYHRLGEKQTVLEFKKILEKMGIVYYTGLYSGDKDQLIITTPNYRFVTTM